LKITPQQQGYYEDFLYAAPVGANNGIEDELVVMTSRPIIERALKNLRLGVRYFTKERMREKELYADAPFHVHYEKIDPRLYGTVFEVRPLDEHRFRLIWKRRTNWKVALKEALGLAHADFTFHYDKVHRYGETIRTPYFTLRLEKRSPTKKSAYFFTVVPEEAMVGYVKGSLDATPQSKFGHIVTLRFSDYVPERAAVIVNAVADAYIQYTLDLKSQSARKQLHFIDMQLDAINKQLKNSAEKLQKYKALNVVIDLSAKSRQLSEKLSELESELYKKNALLERIDTALEKLNDKNLHAYDFDLPLTDIPAVAPIITQLRELFEKYETLSVNYTPQYPAIRKLLRRIRFLKNSLLRSLEDVRKQIAADKKRLQKEIDTYRNKIKAIPEQEQEIEALSRHFLVNEKIYSYLLEKRAETAILASSTISNVKIVERALVPSSPTRPNRKILVMVGFVFGLLLGVLQAFLRNFFDTTVHTPEDVEEMTDLPIYAKLPVKEKNRAGVYNEAMRTLWINLSFTKAKRHAKIITVTSDISKEGKTFTASNLARIIAKSTDKKVLLIDMDMRKPSLHSVFGMQNGAKGVTTLLSGLSEPEETVRTVENLPNLHLVTGGPKAPNPTKLIMSEHFKTILEKFSQSYDFIVIDTSPIGLVADALNIMRHSDITLFIIRMEYSRKEYIKRIDELKERTDTDIGLVLNSVNGPKGYYSDYVYKHYYHAETDE
jgi:capsular exopolysaccharide synthesis family protein